MRLSSDGWTPDFGTKVKWQFVLLYFHDIVIFLQKLNEHIGHFRQVLRLLYNADVKLNLKKWEFFTSRIDYLRHVIRSRRLEVSIHMIETKHRLESPTTVT